MLIEFAETADYWLGQCHKAKKEGRSKDALVFARKALDLSDAFACWFAYAETLFELEQYAMSASVCLRHGTALTEEQFPSFCALMAENSAKLNNMAAYMHYQLTLLHEMDDIDENFDLNAMLMDFLSQLEGKEKGNKLMFVDDALKHRERRVYDAMYEAYHAEDYRRVIALAEDIPTDGKYYAESLFLKGMSLAKIGEEEKGKTCLWQMYGLTNHDVRVLYYLDEIGDGLTDAEMERALSALAPDGNKDNMAMAAICAGSHGLDRTALYYATEAYKLAPNEPEHIFRLAAAYINLGDRQAGDRYYREVLETYNGFFPRVLRDMPLEAPVDLYFDFAPQEVYDGLSRYVKRQLAGEYAAVLMQTDMSFRESVYFLLTTPSRDTVAQAALAAAATEWMTPEGIAFQRDLLLEPMLPKSVRFRLLYNLLDKVRTGHVRLNIDLVAETFKLKVPASYDDFDEQMKRIFVYAYAEMTWENAHNELKLSRICEKLYLNLPDGYYQANVMGYAVVSAAKIVDAKHEADGVLRENGWDADLYMEYVDLVKKTLKNA